MGDNNLKLYFVYEEYKDVSNKKFNLAFIQEFLSVVGGDVCTKKKIVQYSKQLYTDTMHNGAKGGIIEIPIKDLYWIGVSIFESQNGTYISLRLDETYIFNEKALADFQKRAKAVYEALKPWYAYADISVEVFEITCEFKPDGLPFTHLFWLNLYSPSIAKRLGEDKILNSVKEVNEEFKGGVELEKLSEGGIMLKIGKVPRDSYTGERKVALEVKIFKKLCKFCSKASFLPASKANKYLLSAMKNNGVKKSFKNKIFRLLKKK